MFTLETISPTKIHRIGESAFVQKYPKESFVLSDPDNSPIESVLYYCSGIINEVRNYSFCINLDGNRFCLPIKPEMSILLGQVGQIMSLLRADGSNSLVVDFFEQGHESQIVFQKSEKSIDVDMIKKQPEVVLAEKIPIDTFESSICRFLLDFIYAVGILDSSILNEPAFVKWFSQVSIGEQS